MERCPIALTFNNQTLELAAANWGDALREPDGSICLPVVFAVVYSYSVKVVIFIHRVITCFLLTKIVAFPSSTNLRVVCRPASVKHSFSCKLDLEYRLSYVTRPAEQNRLK